MLINALCDYYDILKNNNDVLPDGYSNVKVHYMVALRPDGSIDEIIDKKIKKTSVDAKGKQKETEFPSEYIFPLRTEKTSIESNIIEHRPLYIFGLNFESEGLNPVDKTMKAQKSHAKFVEINLEFIKNIDSPLVNAFRNYLLNWTPEKEVENVHLKNLGKAYTNSNYVFCLSGRPDLLLQNDPLIMEHWEKLVMGSEDISSVTAQCAISGTISSIAKIHSKIKGISGGLSTGGVLVGFNNSSEESYGNTQSYNSNISESVMRKYTEALNYLLNGTNHKKYMDGITLVYWAMSNEKEKEDFMASLFFGEEGMDANETDGMLTSLISDARDGKVLKSRIASVEGISPNVDFYMVGLKPNSSRISVKFVYRKKYGDLLENIAKHQRDMQVSDPPTAIAIWKIKKELISPKSKNEEVDPSLLTKIFEAIMYDKNYPASLLSIMIKRVKTDTDLKINIVRAGVIKACINRKSRLLGEKEELTVALNKENKNQAYLCGRLFAVLEKLQQDISNNSLNRTIKDAYFSSATSKPAMIFPKLLKLSQNHLNKAKNPTYYNILVGEIMNDLQGEFPEHLYLADQGKFIIGYYQQYQNFFIKKNDNLVTEQEEE